MSKVHRLDSSSSKTAACRDPRCPWYDDGRDESDLGIQHRAMEHAEETGHVTDAFMVHTVTYGKAVEDLARG